MSDDTDLLIEEFTAIADQVAACGHVIPSGGTIVTVRRGPAVIVAQLCGRCYRARYPDRQRL